MNRHRIAVAGDLPRVRSAAAAVVVAIALLLTLAACRASTDAAQIIEDPSGQDAPNVEPAETAPSSQTEPTPTTEPTPEPTATAEPTPEPTPTPSPDLERLSEAALAALDETPHLTQSYSWTARVLGLNLTATAATRIDKQAGTSATEVNFDGLGWNAFPRDDLEDELFLNEVTLIYRVDESGRTYLTTEPLAPSADPATPWTELGPFDLVATGYGLGLGAFGTEQISGLVAAHLDAAIAGEVVRLEPSTDRDLVTFKVLVPNSNAYDLAPSNFYEELKAAGIAASDMTGSTEARVSFRNEKIISFEIDFGSFLEEVRELGGAEFEAATISSEMKLTYEPVTIDLPDPSEIQPIEDPSAPVTPVLAIGDCVANGDLLAGDLVRVPCDQAHYAEVFHVSLLDNADGAPYPGEDEVFQAGLDACTPTFSALTGVHIFTSVLEVQIAYPLEENWLVFDRAVTCLVVFDEPTTTRIAEVDPVRHDGRVSTYGLQTGDCFSSDSIYEFEFTLQECADPHLFEVYNTTELDPGPFPGEEAMQSQAREVCLDAFPEAIGEEYLDSSWSIDRLYPSEETWDLYDDRTIVCTVTGTSPTEGSALQN